LCANLIDLYDKSSRQLYNLATKWRDFKERWLVGLSLRILVSKQKVWKLKVLTSHLYNELRYEFRQR
jgi:hypothetical protein